MASNSMRVLGFFEGLQPCWLSSDRVYRIYVSDKLLSGAYIAGQFFDERSAYLQLQLAAVFFRRFVRRCLARRQEREALYDSSDPLSPQLLEQDPRNFQIDRSEVARTRLRRNRSLWTPFNAGVVEVTLFDGSIRRLILVGEQQADEVLDLLRKFDPGIEESGKSKPIEIPKPPTLEARGRLFISLALMFLGYAGFFAYAGLGLNPRLLVLAVVNLLGALWCLVSAWRQRRDRPPTEGTE
jgi:hypothetical protein